VHGQTGLLVRRGKAEELAAAIGKLLDDPALARAMGMAGRLRAVEHFSWDVVSRRLADLIESVLAASRERSGAGETTAQVAASGASAAHRSH
jgi:glycosyltransferase involved in cell wall biosynthesis